MHGRCGVPSPLSKALALQSLPCSEAGSCCRTISWPLATLAYVHRVWTASAERAPAGAAASDMTPIPFLLRALKYPRVDGFSPEDPAHFQAAVVWLENTKVRRYPIDGRAALQSPDRATLQAALRRYLSDLECPLALDSASQPALLQWLLLYAVGLEYQDSSAQLTQLAQQAEAEAAPPEEWTEAQLPPFDDITAEPVRAALLDLQQVLHVEAAGAGTQQQPQQPQRAGGPAPGPAEASPEALHKAHAMLETCVLPALAELAKQRRQQQAGGGVGGAAAPSPAPLAAGAGGDGGGGGAAASQHAAVSAMLAQYPLGFSTGDAGADLASTILRMLYIKDLRALQTLVDSAIVQVQEYTANPRTDASLGKVGR
ncbi:hypothetical protein ABPG75_004701 [Micractinium tetrahymenae]